MPADHPLAGCPGAEAAGARLAGATVSTVTFYSGTSYGGERIYRNKDWFVGRELVASKVERVAEGGRGYIV